MAGDGIRPGVVKTTNDEETHDPASKRGLLTVCKQETATLAVAVSHPLAMLG